jgi:hypothetical protein
MEREPEGMWTENDVPQIKAATDLFEDTDENHEQHRNSRCLA